MTADVFDLPPVLIPNNVLESLSFDNTMVVVITKNVTSRWVKFELLDTGSLV
jgi:hypothetical protein